MSVAKHFKTLLRLASVALCLSLVVLLALLSTARIETTASGVHKRLRIPMGSKAIAIPLYAGTGDRVFLRGHLDGPVVRRTGSDTWTASWFCQDRAVHVTGRGDTLRIVCAGKSQVFFLGEVPVPPAVAPMPEHLIVLSDLEGNSVFMEGALRKLGIVDAAGDWKFARGQLVVLGDSVDRGIDVFAVLWRLRTLALQAQAAGGAVHVVLGNHEQYVLGHNLTRAHPAHRYALQAIGGYARAFDADTVIGAWLREQPVALKLGHVLFTHGGVSPAVVRSGLDVDALNATMRTYWQQASVNGGTSLPGTATAVLGITGVTQYRGYFHSLEGRYSRAGEGEIDQVLHHHKVDQIVVGHTLVDRVMPLHGGKVWAIDVNDDSARSDVLTYTHGVATVLKLGLPRDIARDEASHLRAFSLLSSTDWQLLAAAIGEFWRLSQLPSPD